MERFTVLDLLQLDLKEHDALNLKCIAGRPGLTRQVTVAEIDRPGLELAGFFDSFAHQRIQVFGRGENAYLAKLHEENQYDTIRRIFSYELPCCVFTYGFEPIPVIYELADEHRCPILQTDLSSAEFSARLLRVLSNVFAPKTTIHGVFMEVFGVGMLIQGQSGVGKSESALALIERGHRLVADDVVEIRCVNGNFLMGKGTSPVTSHHMEIRGLGIINITHLFGVGAVRDEKRVQMVVQLEEWDPKKEYDRVGGETGTIEIMGVRIPYLVIPIRPGRNVPIIMETAAMNERLKRMGFDSSREFQKNVMTWLEKKRAHELFLGEDGEL
jgi:HPr kinase/phosphorylase